MGAASSIPSLGWCIVFTWLRQAARIIARRPADIVLCAFCLAYILGGPLDAARTSAIFLPLWYAPLMGLCCRRLLHSGHAYPQRMPWRRLFVLGATVCLPLALPALILGLFWAEKGAFLLLFLFGWIYMLGVQPVLVSILWSAIPLLVVALMGFAPGFIAARGAGVGEALAASLRCWRRNPLSLGAAFCVMVAQLAAGRIVFEATAHSFTVFAIAWAYGYSIACIAFGFALCVAASASMLERQIVDRPL